MAAHLRTGGHHSLTPLLTYVLGPIQHMQVSQGSANLYVQAALLLAQGARLRGQSLGLPTSTQLQAYLPREGLLALVIRDCCPHGTGTCFFGVVDSGRCNSVCVPGCCRDPDAAARIRRACGRPGWLDGWMDRVRRLGRCDAMERETAGNPCPSPGISSLPGQGLLAAPASPSAEKIRGCSPLLPLVILSHGTQSCECRVHRMQEYPLLCIVFSAARSRRSRILHVRAQVAD